MKNTDQNTNLKFNLNDSLYCLEFGYNLVNHLVKTGGYLPTGYTPGLFKHLHCPVSFSLIVDDFDIKYEDHAIHVHHLWQHPEESTL